MAVGSNKSWSSLSLSLGLLLLVVGKGKSREGWLRLPPRYISVIKAIEIETNGLGSFLPIFAAGSPSYVISPHPHPVCVCVPQRPERMKKTAKGNGRDDGAGLLRPPFIRVLVCANLWFLFVFRDLRSCLHSQYHRSNFFPVKDILRFRILTSHY